ncbi:MAG: hypothetical protein Ct9H300mP26_3200 [Acidimicrobiales bacterium]|nr:MAG: hypothetical protein Ct9H300mP26_3200 [Acidimicrobiales bacterium]
MLPGFDAGGALVVTSSDRAKDYPKPPVYVLGTGGALEAGVMSPGGVRNLCDRSSSAPAATLHFPVQESPTPT